MRENVIVLKRAGKTLTSFKRRGERPIAEGKRVKSMMKENGFNQRET